MIGKLGIASIYVISIIAVNYDQSQAKSKAFQSADKTLVGSGTIKAALETINQRAAQFYLHKNIDSLTGLYAEKFTFLPEYKKAIVQIKSLRKFYADWFHAVSNMNYKKSIYKVEAFSKYVLEIGNFSLSYSTVQHPENNYAGKYMVMWEREAKKKWAILSEAFGCDKQIGPDDVPYASVKIEDGFVLDSNRVSNQVKPEIEQVDRVLTKAVVEGNGKARADGFTKDGMYLPHFGPLLEGRDVLLPYMMKTYTPSAKLYVRNTYREIFNLGEFVFINGHFKGGWGDPITGGKFEGNMSNLMKRNANGKLLMYRQLASNDR